MNGDPRWILENQSFWWLAGCGAALALALWSGLTAARGRSTRLKLLLISVRLLAVAAACVAILRPQLETDLVRPKRPPLMVVVDDSASMTLGVKPQGTSALEWLKFNKERLDALDKVYKVEVSRLGPRAAGDDFPPTELSWFKGADTPLGRTLEELARLKPDADGMILLSDGRDTGNPSRPPVLGMPVYPVVGDSPPLIDAWLETVEAPPVGFIRTPVEVRVKVGSQGLPEGETGLTLLEDGLVVATSSLKVGTRGGEGTITFTPHRTGRKAYRVELAARTGEASRANNAAQFTINVIRDKTRILVVAGTPTWDVKALRRRLASDPGIDMITFLILRTPMDSNLIDASELSLIPFPTEELFNKELPSFDAVFMLNFDYAPYVPAAYLANLVKFVKDAGGGLVMVGGDRSFGLGGYENSPLAQVLPVELSNAPAGRLLNPSPFKPRLTEAGESHPVTGFGDSLEKTRAVYRNLPELAGLNWVLKTRPGATTLLEAPQVKNEYGAAPVIVVGDAGAGRVMAITTDSLWRWGMGYAAQGGGEAFYRDFWTRSLRWLVHDPDMELVRLNPPGQTVRAGSEISFGARVLSRDYKPAEGAKLSGSLTDEGGKAVELAWKERAPGEYVSLPIRVEKQGLVRVKVEAFSGAGLLGRDEAGFAVEPPSPEPLRVGVDADYLEKLAKAGGGKVYAAADVSIFEELQKRGEAKKETVGKKVEQPWQTGFFLAIVIALLGLDWALRRLNE